MGMEKRWHYIKNCYKKKNEQKVDEGNVVEPLSKKTIDVYVVTKSTIELNTANFVNNSD